MNWQAWVMVGLCFVAALLAIGGLLWLTVRCSGEIDREIGRRVWPFGEASDEWDEDIDTTDEEVWHGPH